MLSSSWVASLILIAVLTGFGWWLAQVSRVDRKLGATMVILMLGLGLATVTRWAPAPSTVAWVNGLLTSLAIAELLLAVDLRTVLLLHVDCCNHSSLRLQQPSWLFSWLAGCYRPGSATPGFHSQACSAPHSPAAV